MSAKICFADPAIDDLIATQDLIINKNMEEVLTFIQNSQKNIKIGRNAAIDFINNANSNSCQLSCENKLLKDFNLPITTPVLSSKSQSSLYIFVSLSMPSIKLIELLADAKKYNAIVVLRGLKNNSFKETALCLQKIIKTANNGLLVEPTLFEKHKVEIVPKFVLVDNTSQKVDQITGNITLQYALEEFAHFGDNKILAEMLLKSSS